MFSIALYQPEIPPNTGNLIRLSVNVGSTLHLIHPLGFSLDEKNLRRAGLDYRDQSIIREHDNFEHFTQAIKPHRLFACSTKGKTRYTDIRYQSTDVFLFGPESRGLPNDILQLFSDSQKIYIPMKTKTRSINLANAVSIIIYEAWRQLQFE